MTTNRYPAAYIRRSSADAGNPGDVSREVQEQAVRDLAHRDGYNGDVHYFVDWARSAAEEKSARRTEYAAMLRDIEAGAISTVYAYALDRLNRSLILSARFAKACEEHDVRIVTHREGEVRQDSPAEWLRWTMLATFGEYELRTIRARAISNIATRKARKDHLGHASYGFRHVKDSKGRIEEVPDPERPLAPVLDAYREARTFLGACTLLDERGVPSPSGKPWVTPTLVRVLERAQKDGADVTLPTRAPGPKGRRRVATAILAHLVRCPYCGKMLTPNAARGEYYCREGARNRDSHPRYVAREWRLLAFVREELEHLIVPDSATLDMQAETRRAAAEARLERARKMFLEGDMPEAEYEREKAAAKAHLEAITTTEAAEALQAVPSVDWEHTPPAELNAVVRIVLSAVVLDGDMRPVSAEWTHDEWRAD